MLLRAATTTEAAMIDSTSREGRLTISSAARLKVIVCAIVNSVTILNTFHRAGRNPSTEGEMTGVVLVKQHGRVVLRPLPIVWMIVSTV